MINLIPQDARKQVVIEYWFRVISVWLVLLAFAFSITGALLVPSLALIYSQISVNEVMYQTASAQNNEYAGLEKNVISANSIAMALVHLDHEALFSHLISELRNIATDKVTIESISFGRSEGVVESIRITGNSKSRSSLVQFRDALEEHPLFESAELPLSNLAKDKDVPFSIAVLVTHNETDL